MYITNFRFYTFLYFESTINKSNFKVNALIKKSTSITNQL